MNQYLIPANSKKSQLYFSLFRGVDLGILGIGGSITLILIFAIKGDSILDMVIKLLPLAISILLVYPVAYYHNVIVFLQELFDYLSSTKRIRWKGWCKTNGSDDDNSKESKQSVTQVR